MAIRFRDQASSLGLVNTVLQNGVALALGTFTPAAARTGTMATQLQPFPTTLTGFFTPAVARTGTIVTTLDAAPTAMQGSAFVPGSASDVTTVTIEGAGTQFVTFGHTFVQAAINSSQSAVLTDNANVPVAAQQCVRKTSHPDGSMRHAILSAQVIGGTTYKIRAATPTAGTSRTIADLLAAVPGDIASVTLTGGVTGTAVLRDLLSSATNRAVGGLVTWEQGTQMLGVAAAQDLGTHVRVIFHVRWYGGTLLWVDYVFENGYVTLAGQGDKSYTASCVLNGTTVLTQAVNHFNHAMWHRSFWSAGGTLYVRHNTSYLIRSKAFPNYDPAFAPTSAFLNTVRQSTAIMDNGDHTDNQNDTGAQPALGILPQWDAAYLCSSGDSRAFKWMYANADGGMVYQTAYLNHATGTDVRIDEFPGRSYFDTAGSSPAWPGGAFTTSSPFVLGNAAHLASIGYTAYAVTGEYAHYRNLQHHGATVVMGPSTSSRQSGGAAADWYRSSLRGQGWSYRNVGQAAYLSATGDTLGTYFTAAINSVASRDTTLYGPGGSSVNNLGCMFMAEGNDTAGNGPYRVFFHMFFVQAAAHLALDLGFASVLPVAKYAGKFVAGLLGSDGQYPYEFAPGYAYVVGPNPTAFFSDFATVKANNVLAGAQSLESGTAQMAAFMAANVAGHTGKRHEIQENQGGGATGVGFDDYFANMQPAASFLEALGTAGGALCWERIRLSGVMPAYNNSPQFSIVPRTETDGYPIPSWRTQAVGEWIAMPNSDSPTSRLSVDGVGVYGAWSGGCYNFDGAVKAGTYVAGEFLTCTGGGHTDSADNTVSSYGPVDGNAPSWFRNTNATVTVTANVQRYSDGRPCASHTYDDIQYVPAGGNNNPGRLALIGRGSQYQNGFANDGFDLYDFTQNGITATAPAPWVAQPDYPVAGNSQQAMSGFNNANMMLYRLGNGNAVPLQKYKISTGVWANSAATFKSNDMTGNPSGEVDHYRNIFVAFDRAGQVIVWNLDSPATAPIVVTPTGSGPPTIGGHALCYDSRRKVFYAWGEGSNKTIYTLTPPATNWFVTTGWTWTSSTPAGGAQPGATIGTANYSVGNQYDKGTYGRFQYSRRLDAIILFSNLSGVYCKRLS